ARLLSVGPADGTRGSGHKVKHRRFPLNIRELFFYCEGDRALAEVAKRGGGISLVGNIKKPSGHGPGQLALGGPALA
ncbi:unnamed protein product, partial [Bubo scandiacus]